jgi:hypothetical protein
MLPFLSFSTHERPSPHTSYGPNLGQISLYSWAAVESPFWDVLENWYPGEEW